MLAEFGGSFSFELLPILEKLGSIAGESFDGDLLLLTPRNLVSTVKYLPNVGLLVLSYYWLFDSKVPLWAKLLLLL